MWSNNCPKRSFFGLKTWKFSGPSSNFFSSNDFCIPPMRSKMHFALKNTISVETVLKKLEKNQVHRNGGTKPKNSFFFEKWCYPKDNDPTWKSFPQRRVPLTVCTYGTPPYCMYIQYPPIRYVQKRRLLLDWKKRKLIGALHAACLKSAADGPRAWTQAAQGVGYKNPEKMGKIPKTVPQCKVKRHQKK